MEYGMAGYSHIGECGVRDPFPVKSVCRGKRVSADDHGEFVVR